MESGKIYRSNPFQGGNNKKTLTLSESGLLHHAMIHRKQEAVMKRYRQMRSGKIRRMFTKDFDKTLQKMTGRTVAKLVYGMWNKGYFDRFEEFSTSSKKTSAETV